MNWRVVNWTGREVLRIYLWFLLIKTEVKSRYIKVTGHAYWLKSSPSTSSLSSDQTLWSSVQTTKIIVEKFQQFMKPISVLTIEKEFSQNIVQHGEALFRIGPHILICWKKGLNLKGCLLFYWPGYKSVFEERY